ncbi:hypothetical protein KSP39_PZI003749 [Platanthera zijinensis]|uniref:Uncharacterized protein n=1 Tax=Platanthera zijinensis TaxID=2320716 RepID=A0AAP0BXB9_9ASPA
MPAAAAAAAAAFPLSLSVDSSLRSSPLPSVSFHRSHPLPIPLSISSFRPASSFIAASSSSSSQGGIFLDALGLHRLQTLDKYIRECGLKCGWLEIRPMDDGEVDPTVLLLSESFAESMGMPSRYVPLLAFLVRQYVVGRRFLFPHAAMLVGFYREGGGEPVLACTAEVSFDARGANAVPPTPPPPKDCPYICNMAVKKELRRERKISTFLDMAIEVILCLM